MALITIPLNFINLSNYDICSMIRYAHVRRRFNNIGVLSLDISRLSTLNFAISFRKSFHGIFPFLSLHPTFLFYFFVLFSPNEKLPRERTIYSTTPYRVSDMPMVSICGCYIDMHPSRATINTRLRRRRVLQHRDAGYTYQTRFFEETRTY